MAAPHIDAEGTVRRLRRPGRRRPPCRRVLGHLPGDRRPAIEFGRSAHAATEIANRRWMGEDGVEGGGGLAGLVGWVCWNDVDLPKPRTESCGARRMNDGRKANVELSRFAAGCWAGFFGGDPVRGCRD
jgi:hypothetical protein